MNPRFRLAIMATGAGLVLLTSPASSQTATTNAASAVAQTNKETVRRAYAAWAAGGTDFFDILDENVVWTIMGDGPSAGTYRGKADFVSRAVEPFVARISVPLKPTVRDIYADGDEVVILWDGAATTRDGRAYRNTYTWFFTMQNGRVVRGRALLDLTGYGEVISRVQPASQSQTRN